MVRGAAEGLEARRKKLIRAVHCSHLWRTVYKDSRPAYEMLLKEHYGVTSSKDMTPCQLSDLLDFLNGRKVSPSRIIRREKPAPRKGKGNVRSLISEAQTRKIWSLCQLIEWNRENGPELWMDHRFGFKQPKTDAQANQVIEGLKGVFENQMIVKHGPDWASRKYDNVWIMGYIRRHKQ